MKIDNTFIYFFGFWLITYINNYKLRNKINFFNFDIKYSFILLSSFYFIIYIIALPIQSIWHNNDYISDIRLLNRLQLFFM